MFDSNTNFRSKREACTTVRLFSGETFVGSVFLKVDERLIDLMNDARAFIPIRREDGDTIIVAKSSIASMIEGRREHASDAGKAGPAAPPADDRASELPTGAEAGAPGGNPAASKLGESSDAGRQSVEDPEDAPEHADDQEKDAPKVDRLASAYKALRLGPEATDAEVKAAYKARMKAVHPDAQVGAGAARERAALHASQIVNRAYKAIITDRGLTKGETVPEASSDPATDASND